MKTRYGRLFSVMSADAQPLNFGRSPPGSGSGSGIAKLPWLESRTGTPSRTRRTSYSVYVIASWISQFDVYEMGSWIVKLVDTASAGTE